MDTSLYQCRHREAVGHNCGKTARSSQGGLQKQAEQETTSGMKCQGRELTRRTPAVS